MLHAGGKFDGKAYAVSGGLHGVGISVVNALSTRIELEIHKDGFVWRQTYRNTKPDPLQKGEPTDATGTSVTFWPDGDDLRDHRLQLRDDLPAAAGDGVPQPGPDDHAARRARRGARRREREVIFCYKGGIADFVRHLNQTKTPIHSRWSSSAPTARACRSRSPCSGTSRTARASTRSPTRSTRTRAARTRRASGPR